MKTLVVGFKKYAGHTSNPAEKVLGLLKDPTIVTMALDVSYEKARAINEAIANEKPDFVITMNLSPFRTEPAIEEYTYNEMNSIQPDEDGEMMMGEEIVEGGPKSYDCSFDIPSIQQYLSANGLSLAVSIDPGRFVCNEVSYLANHSGVPTISLHIPLEKDFPLKEVAEIIENLVAYYQATH